MHYSSAFLKWLPLAGLIACGAPQQTPETVSADRVDFIRHDTERRIDITAGGQLFTSYRWPPDIMKPVLYPLLTANGTAVSRGFPIAPRQGERVDHPHHVGLWFNYGNIDGFDFWNNSPAIPEAKRNESYGRIVHGGVDELIPGDGEGTMLTHESWVGPQGREIMKEKTEYHFIVEGPARIIDRITTLTAGDSAVSFGDSKEGLLGIRVARQLEMPSNEALTLTDDRGIPTEVKQMSNEGVSGNYRSSEGITGENVWGTRAKWMELSGTIGDEKISLVICDHPDNLNYPTYWHARGYGLFAANPLGVKEFTEGKETLNYQLPAGQSVTFRYRVIIYSGPELTADRITAYAEAFAGKYSDPAVKN